MRLVPIYLLLLASLACEAIALYSLLEVSGRLGFMAFLGLHAGAAGLAAESLQQSALHSGFAGRNALAAAGVFLSFAFPVVGSLVVAYLVVARPHGTRVSVPGESLENRRERAALEAIERKRAAQQIGGRVHSIADALKDRDKDVRIAAVESLRGEVSKKAVKFLAQSQANTVFDVRVRAIENLNLLRDQFRTRLAESRQKVAAQGSGVVAWQFHAELCLENAELGIEDERTVTKLYEEAFEHASRVSEMAPDARSAREVSARSLRILKRYKEAEHQYALVLMGNSHDMGAMYGLAEMQFLQRDFNSLRETCRLIVRAQAGKLDTTFAPVMKLWLKGSEEIRA